MKRWNVFVKEWEKKASDYRADPPTQAWPIGSCNNNAKTRNLSIHSGKSTFSEQVPKHAKITNFR